MSGDIGLGRVIQGIAHRDAVHVAVVPVEATVALKPGQRVNKDGLPTGEIVGVADPFLEKDVRPGQRFYLCLFPGSITSLRHEWTHPAFDGIDATASDRAESEEWLRSFCDRANCPEYDWLIAMLNGEKPPGDEDDDGDDYRVFFDGDYLHVGGRDASGEIPPEFWTHVETVLGKKMPRASYFSCSC